MKFNKVVLFFEKYHLKKLWFMRWKCGSIIWKMLSLFLHGSSIRAYKKGQFNWILVHKSIFRNPKTFQNLLYLVLKQEKAIFRSNSNFLSDIFRNRTKKRDKLSLNTEMHVKLIKNKASRLLIWRRLIPGALPWYIFVPLKQYGRSNTELKHFRTRFMKRL